MSASSGTVASGGTPATGGTRGTAAPGGTTSVAGLRELCDIKIDRFSLPREQIEKLIHRDALALLNLPNPLTADTGATR